MGAGFSRKSIAIRNVLCALCCWFASQFLMANFWRLGAFDDLYVGRFAGRVQIEPDRLIQSAGTQRETYQDAGKRFGTARQFAVWRSATY